MTYGGRRGWDVGARLCRYFHDSVERVATAFAADVRRLAEAGHSVAIEMPLPGYIRATVSESY